MFSPSMSLTATRLPVAPWVASYTTPIPPRPSNVPRRYFPATRRSDTGVDTASTLGDRSSSLQAPLCVHDLGVLGFTVTDFPERHATRMFYEPQYFKIEHRDATALFGYILVLEVLASAGDARAMLATLEKAHGEKSFSFVKLHC